MDVHSQLGTGRTSDAVDLRRHPRFKLEVEIRVYPRDSAVVRGHTVDISKSGISAMLREEVSLGGMVRGHTVDISESGISAMLREEVPLGGMVRLEFTLPLGEVEILAMVRQRNAFRYGFQFVEESSANDIIGRTCRQLAVAQR